MTTREKLEYALSLPVAESKDDIGIVDLFDPWENVIQGIYGNYAEESDQLMITTLEAVRDGTTLNLIRKEGFIVEFMLYVLAGHGLTDYGTSPRGAWPESEIQDLWQPLIDKWKAYSKVKWS